MHIDKIHEMLEQLVETKDGELSAKLIEALRDTVIMLPVVLPPDTEPEKLQQIQQLAQSKKSGIPSDLHPIPAILEDKSNNKLMAVFTTEEEIHKNQLMNRFPLILHLPFQKALGLLEQLKDVNSIVLNPFHHNFRIDFQGKHNETKEDTKKVTQAQFHALVRQHVEATLLPKLYFEHSEEVISKLKQDGAAYLLSLYRPPYEKTNNCPYDESDFDVISIMIRDNLIVTQIILPSKNLYVTTCPSIYLVYNPVLKESFYYAIVLCPDKIRKLHQVFEDGTNSQLGEAPSPGSELQAIVDLHQ